MHRWIRTWISLLKVKLERKPSRTHEMGLVIESSRFNSLSKNLLGSFDALRARPELDEGTNGEDLNYLRNFRSC